MTTKVTHGVTSFNAGQVIQSVYAEYLLNADLSTQIPADDTIPQITEGTEIVTASITPKYATSKLRVRFVGVAVVNTVDTGAAVALFRDATANALAAANNAWVKVGYQQTLALAHEEVAGSVAATTFRVRAGPATAINMRFNGSNTGRLFGGVSKVTLIVEEVAV